MLNRPNLKIFINSLRDIGYSCETAVADLIDNSIAADAKQIKIYALPSRGSLVILDDGCGMNRNELVEAMRLGTIHEQRTERDLGSFGLGLKTASFSQCRNLTVVSSQNHETNCFCWDLDYLAEKDDWEMISPDINSIQRTLNELDPSIWTEYSSMSHGTIVLWQKIDRYDEKQFNEMISNVTKHLALVFHKYLGQKGYCGHHIEMYMNNNRIKAFNPFASRDDSINRASQTGKPDEFILSSGEKMSVTYHVLPPLGKLSKQEYDELGTLDGFTKSQGFYLYRQGRLLVYGTWFGLAKIHDASNLVRIEIEINNKQDHLWKIDVKKSTAYPVTEIKNYLKHYVNKPIERAKRVYKNAGVKTPELTDSYWNETVNPSGIALNFENQRFKELNENLSPEQKKLLLRYLNCLQYCYPKERLYNLMVVSSPSEILQGGVSEELVKEEIEYYKEKGKSRDSIRRILLKDEYFMNSEQLIDKVLAEYYE